MHRLRNILFATDFSASAERALRYAQALAKREAGTLHFLHVLESARNSAPGTENDNAPVDTEDKARAELERLGDLARDAGIETACHLRHGKPWREIVDEAVQANVDVVLIASHGHGGFEHLVFGGTCEKVVRLCPVPVLTIKDSDREYVDEAGSEIRLTRVLCPYDFSKFSSLALPIASSLCRSFDATLILSHVMYPYFEFPNFSGESVSPSLTQPTHPAREALARVAGDLEGVRSEIQIFVGLPHRELGHFIEETRVDLVVMATHGHTGISQMLLGSVAEKILRTAPCPVMTIRPPREEGEKGE